MVFATSCHFSNRVTIAHIFHVTEYSDGKFVKVTVPSNYPYLLCIETSGNLNTSVSLSLPLSNLMAYPGHGFCRTRNSFNGTKLNARLALRQRADLFKANIPANKITLPQGHSCTELYIFSFCIALAMRKANFVSRNIVLFNYTSSDVWLQHLYTRDPAKPNQCGSFTRRVDLCTQRFNGGGASLIVRRRIYTYRN